MKKSLTSKNKAVKKKVPKKSRVKVVEPKKTIVINLYGGPGTGKSTTAGDLFAFLKKRGVNCELVREYVKDWVWEGRKIRTSDQVYILAKQARREQILYGEVEVIITDAPMWLSPIYESEYGCFPFVCDDIVFKFQQEAESRGVEFVHVFLNRVKPYNPAGRHQNEKQAKEIDKKIKDYMTKARMKFFEFDATDGVAQKIARKFKLSKISK